MRKSVIDKYRTKLAAGSIDRRQFVLTALAAGASLPIALSMANKVQAATPKKGGTLRLAIAGGSTTDTLAPGTLNDDGGRLVSWAVRSSLTEISPDGSLAGDLAESWDVSPDAKTWTVMLRKGVSFHSGKTVDADDVVASFNVHRGEDSKSSAKSLLDQVDEIRTDGKDKVVFSLKGGNADFAVVLSDYNLFILPAKDGQIDPLSKDGTGTYKLSEFDPGVRAMLTRDPNGWKDGRGHFEAAEVTYVADALARTTALRSRSVDVVNRVDLKTVKLLQAVPDVKVEEVTGTQHYTIPMHTDTAPFTDNNVRMALKHAIDRQAMVDKILLGHGKVANDHPIAPSNRYFAKDIPQREYDPEKARFYLKQAGLDSLKVQLSAADAAFSGAVDAAVLYSDAAAKAGIEIEVVKVANDGYWDNIWLKAPWCFSYWTGRPTEDWMFSQAYAPDANWNESRWKNPRFAELLIAARTELDEAKRSAMYEEMQLLVRDDGGSVIPMYSNYVWATGASIAHDEAVAANWDLDGNRCIERWWFAES